MSQNNNEKRTASQRIEALERGVVSMYGAFDSMARDLLLVKDALKILGNKVDAIAQVLGRGEALTDDSIAKQMVANNVEKLKQDVEGYLERGLMATSESVTERSFVVGKEHAPDGTLVNPRIQFMVGTLDPSLQVQLIGKKVGDKVVFQADKLDLELLEIYELQAPQAPEANSAPESEDSSEEQATGTETPSAE